MNLLRKHQNIVSTHNHSQLVEFILKRIDKFSESNKENREELRLLGVSDVEQFHDRWQVIDEE